MSKLQEKIDLYTSEVEKLGLGLNAELLAVPNLIVERDAALKCLELLKNAIESKATN